MGWYELVAIIDEARDIDVFDASTPPVSCPNDYTTLLEGPDGILWCPWDGWQFPGDA